MFMIIYDKNNDRIIFRNGKYFLCFEDGGHVSRYWEIEISKEDADKVIQDGRYATKLILDYQNKLWGLV